MATAHLYQSQPPSHPAPYPNAAADAERLYKAMKGLGTDEKVLNEILGTRTRDQLQEVKKVFEQKYGKTLAHWIKGETSGHYEELCLALIEDKADYDALMVNHAIKGLGTDDDELVELICTRTNAELHAMKQAYQRLFHKEAEKDISGDTSGDYKRLLLAILRCERAETAVNVEEAKRDANLLYEKGEGKIGTDENTFIEILSKRSYPQLHAINTCYINLRGHSLERAIKSETSGNFRKALITILTPRDEYFADKIHDSVACVGTKDHQLIRCISFVTNSKPLCQAINSYYAHKHKNSVAKDVGSDTSGNYGKLCSSVLGNRTAL